MITTTFVKYKYGRAPKACNKIRSNTQIKCLTHMTLLNPLAELAQPQRDRLAFIELRVRFVGEIRHRSDTAPGTLAVPSEESDT